jgi:hypothetical protein
LAHGVYDFFILSRLSVAGIPGTFISVAFLSGMYLLLASRIRLARRLSPFRPGGPGVILGEGRDADED